MKKITFALAALLAVGTANATTISGPTATFGLTATDFSALPLTLAGYDHSAGTLLGIILTLTGHIETQFTASNSSEVDGTLNSANTTSTMTLMFGGSGLVTTIPAASLTSTPYTITGLSSTHNVGPLATGDNSTNQTFSTPASIVSAFDSGPVDFTVNSSTQTASNTSGGNVAVGQNTNGSGSIHVDFIVGSATPEPASLAMIGGGLTAIACLLRRRKAA